MATPAALGARRQSVPFGREITMTGHLVHYGSHPEVSVIVPAFNAAKTLRQQLLALTDQIDAPSTEILVVDNGSTDSTVEVVHGFIQELNSGSRAGLRLVSAPERTGASHARNVGASLALAKKFAFCDSDDVVSQYWLRDIAEALDTVAVISGAAIPIRDADFVASDLLTLRRLMGDRPDRQNLEVKRGQIFPILMGGNFAVTREVYRRLGGFDESFPSAAEDNDLGIRANALLGYSAYSTAMRIAYRTRTAPSARRRLAYTTGRAHVQLCVRHGLIRSSELVPAPQLTKVVLRTAAAFARGVLRPRSADWPAIQERWALVAGLISGTLSYRVGLPEAVKLASARPPQRSIGHD
ncbi:glycosyltransferase family 2 protein [Micrococcus terreus]|nr:glycosyltransferase family A protein [Micrococcus terreus]